MNDDQQSYNITIRHRPTTPPEATITYPNGRIVALTPANTAQVQQILNRAARAKQVAGAIDTIAAPEEDTLDIHEALQKVGKATMRAMADSLIYSTTNSELIEQNRR